MLPPHLHARGTNYVVAVHGNTTTYMYEENGARLVTQVLTPGQATIFPQASMHMMMNTGMLSCFLSWRWWVVSDVYPPYLAFLPVTHTFFPSQIENCARVTDRHHSQAAKTPNSSQPSTPTMRGLRISGKCSPTAFRTNWSTRLSGKISPATTSRARSRLWAQARIGVPSLVWSDVVSINLKAPDGHLL